jgi:hypothetical protein
MYTAGILSTQHIPQLHRSLSLMAIMREDAVHYITLLCTHSLRAMESRAIAVGA